MAYSSIFVGSIYPPEMLDSIIRENSHVDFAANTFQMGIVEGLTRFYDDFHIITSPVTSKYPISRKLCYGHKKLSLEFSGKSINVVFPGFINLPLIKLVTEFLRIKRNLKNLLKDGDTVTVIKDLKVKGSSSPIKIGTKVKNIRLVDGDHNIDCKIDGF